MKNIKVGVFGADRGVDIEKNMILLDCEIVALCDSNEKRRNEGLEKLGMDVEVFSDFDEFIKTEMDAVIIANYFHEHAPFAIKCFERNIHVFCECISNGTMAEGVELVRAFEKSNSIFMLAENYPQMIFNREIKRVCDGGTLGKILYAEGEYNHPVSSYDLSFAKGFVYFTDHWRNFLPRSYYITHSLAPLMWATGATPKRVNALAVYAPFNEEITARRVEDRAAIITTVNDDNSVFRVTGCSAFGAHHNSYRVCGENGQIENLRGMNDKIMLRYNEWSVPSGREEVNFYEPVWNDRDEDFINQAGHGGGDYIVARMFLDCIKEKKQPERPYDIYSSTVMASVGILAHRSILNGGCSYEIPDFRLEEYRKEYENDRLTPFMGADGSEPSIPCCSVPDCGPTQEQLRKMAELLK